MGQLNVELSPDTFPPDVLPLFQFYAQEVTTALQRRLAVSQQPLPRPLFCHAVNSDSPLGPPITLTGSWHPGEARTIDPTSIRIYVVRPFQSVQFENKTVPQIFALKFVYEFGHEMAHVMMEPRRSNGVIESIASAVSLQILRDLADQWKAHPGKFTQHLIGSAEPYVNGIEEEALKAYPEEVQRAIAEKQWNNVALYIRRRRREQDQDLRSPLNTLAAIVLLRSNAIRWKNLAGLGSTIPYAPDEKETFIWRRELDYPQIPLLATMFCRIGRACPTDFFWVRSIDRPQPPQGQRGFLIREAAPDNSGLRPWIWLAEVPAASAAEALKWFTRPGESGPRGPYFDAYCEQADGRPCLK